jgi:hypothetical protein
MTKRPHGPLKRLFAELRELPTQFAADFQDALRRSRDPRFRQPELQPGWIYTLAGGLFVAFALSVLLNLLVRS